MKLVDFSRLHQPVCESGFLCAVCSADGRIHPCWCVAGPLQRLQFEGFEQSAVQTVRFEIRVKASDTTTGFLESQNTSSSLLFPVHAPLLLYHLYKDQCICRLCDAVFYVYCYFLFSPQSHVSLPEPRHHVDV